MAAGVAVGICRPKHPHKPVHSPSPNAVVVSSDKHSPRRNLSSRNNALLTAEIINAVAVVSHNHRGAAVAARAGRGNRLSQSCFG